MVACNSKGTKTPQPRTPLPTFSPLPIITPSPIVGNLLISATVRPPDIGLTPPPFVTPTPIYQVSLVDEHIPAIRIVDKDQTKKELAESLDIGQADYPEKKLQMLESYNPNLPDMVKSGTVIVLPPQNFQPFAEFIQSSSNLQLLNSGRHFLLLVSQTESIDHLVEQIGITRSTLLELNPKLKTRSVIPANTILIVVIEKVPGLIN